MTTDVRGLYIVREKVFSLLLVFCVVMVLVSCNSPVSGVRTANQNPRACYRQFGVTLSGAEGVGTDYSRPTSDELQYYSSKGVKLIRLEVGWDKLQPALGQPLHGDELQWVENFVTQANQYGMQVDIDLHQRSQYNDLNFGTGGIDPKSLVDFWRRFAGELVKDHVPGICGFGIANEPNHDTEFLGEWSSQANAVISSISEVDHDHLIFVPEDNWDSSKHWSPEQASQIRDTPWHQVIFEAHSYWDKGGSGDYNPDIPPPDDQAANDVVVNSLRPFINWCKKTSSRCFVGEFGVPSDGNWLNALNYALLYMEHNNVFGAYWAGGPGYNDSLSIEPVNGRDSAQMHVLEKYLP